MTAELNEALYRPGFGAAFSGEPPPLPGPLPGPKGQLQLAWGNAGGDQAVTAIYSPRPGLFHVLTWTPNWGLLDPSVAGGMGRKKLLQLKVFVGGRYVPLNA